MEQLPRPVSLLVILALSALVSCSDRSDDSGPRNVLLVVIDTLRADRLGCYQYDRGTSPNIDLLAKAGATFMNHRAQGTWTRPSMLSMMSGQYVTQYEEVLPSSMPALAERIQETGRLTAAFVGNPLLTGERGFQRGFDTFVPLNGVGRAERVVGEFESWFLENRNEIRDRGFFAWIHVMDPHTPRRPAPRFSEALGGGLPNRSFLGAHVRDGVEKGIIRGHESRSILTEAIMDNELYDGEVLGADTALGGTLEFLEQERVFEDTLIIVASDHGEVLYEHYLRPEKARTNPGDRDRTARDMLTMGHGLAMYEEEWRVPLIVVGPGVERGVIRRDLTANIDIYPTVLNLLGLDSVPALRGADLMSDDPIRRNHIFSFSHGVVGVVTDRGMKFIDRTEWSENLEPAKRRLGAGEPVLELYDIARDPYCLLNLADERPEEIQRYQSLVHQWKKVNDREVDTSVSARDERILFELGYIGDDH